MHYLRSTSREAQLLPMVEALRNIAMCASSSKAIKQTHFLKAGLSEPIMDLNSGEVNCSGEGGKTATPIQTFTGLQVVPRVPSPAAFSNYLDHTRRHRAHTTFVELEADFVLLR